MNAASGIIKCGYILAMNMASRFPNQAMEKTTGTT